MSESLEGEIVGRHLVGRAGLVQVDGVLHYMIHVVDLPRGGKIDGMGRDEALALARHLGTIAYQARATLVIRTQLVVVEPIEQISG